MATTTFTGTVRSNGNGNRANYAGSMSMVAQFYVPSTVAAAGTDAQVSSTDTVSLVLSGLAIFIASINIFGGFAVTKRMLGMFKK